LRHGIVELYYILPAAFRLSIKRALNMKTTFPYSQAVVVGGTGQTGHRVLEQLIDWQKATGQTLNLIATSRDVRDGYPTSELAATVDHAVKDWGSRVRWFDLDLDAQSISAQLEKMKSVLDTTKPLALIVAASYTNVEGCETDQEKCERINERNTLAVFEWHARHFKGVPVFYSTDYVFDGVAGPYSEGAPLNAESRYGQSKVTIENWFSKQAPHGLVLRTTGVFDYLAGSKNFLMQLLGCLENKKTMKVPRDQWANPVWTVELARATVELLAKGSRGVFHVAGGEQLARSDFAFVIADVFGFDASQVVVPVLTSDLGQKAKRPLRGGLKCDKLRKELGWAPAPAREVLQKFKGN
jgi:dTDP-4-dehydrorhamnose reductase